jgi:hypothetical protein
MNDLAGNSLWGPTASSGPAASDLLGSETLGADGQFATVSLGSLTDYRELQLVVRTCSLRAVTTAADLAIRLNGDSGATSYQTAYGTNIPSALSDARRVASEGLLGPAPTDAGGFVALGLSLATIPLPSEAIRHAIRFSAAKLNTSGVYDSLKYTGTAWHMTEAAVTSLTLISLSGSDFLAGSNWRIYGVR